MKRFRVGGAQKAGRAASKELEVMLLGADDSWRKARRRFRSLDAAKAFGTKKLSKGYKAWAVGKFPAKGQDRTEAVARVEGAEREILTELAKAGVDTNAT